MKKSAITFVFSFLVAVAASAQVDRSQLPDSGPAPVINIGKAETFTLDNGLKVFLVKNDKLPRVSFTLVLDRDPILEGDKAGMTGFVGEMLTAGTTTRTKDQIDSEVDFIGGTLTASSTSLYASALKKHQSKILDLMADVLNNPVFPAEELEKLKKQTLTALAQSKDNPDAISRRLVTSIVYGKEHPYGEIETEETVKNVTVDDIKLYYHTFFKPNIAYLAIVGDMDKAEAEEVAKKYFADWKPEEVPTYTYSMPSRVPTTVVGLVDRSASVQTVIDVVQPVQLKIGDENYISSRLLNQILGGGSSSRLFMNLREDKGFTYGAYSSIGSDKLTAEISANASVRTEVTDSAVYEILYELNTIVEKGVSEEELENAKSYIAGSFGRSLESPSTIANFAINTERYDLPEDYYATYLQKMNDMTVEDVNTAAKTLINPGQFYITAVGNGTEIKDKLAKFGEVRMYDNMGNPARKVEMADTSMTVEKVIANYLTAIGGKDKVSAIKTAKLSMKAEVMGTELIIETMHDDANMRFAQKTIVGGNVMQSTVLKDGIGSATMQGQTMQLPDEQIDAGKLGAYFIPELHYNTMGYEVLLDGVKDVEGQDAYKVTVTSPLGASMSSYYAVESGLKLKSESAQTGEIAYKDYQEKEGILYPMTQVITSPAIPMPLEAKVENLELNPVLTDADFE